jgi:hypothetical protein
LKVYEGYIATAETGDVEPAFVTDFGYNFTLDTQLLSISPENTYVFRD